MLIVLCIVFSVFSVKANEVAGESECDDSRMIQCSSFYPEEDIEKAGMVPNEEDLNKYCPDLLKMTNCIDSYEEECGQPKEDIFPYFVYEKPVYKEMCNKDSKLRSLYLQTFDCFKRVEHIMEPCHKKAISAYKVYNESISSNEVEAEENYEPCLEMSYTLGCLGVEILATCDGEAYKRFLEIENIKESSWLRSYCKQINYEKEMKTGFLSAIEIEEDHKRIYNEMFELLRLKLERP
ncbi:uncharacterized protein NPIL_508241 [Nephila pilipes]|uniref:DUF19 domain-containing protein n=1 Tax=Nephila pilipes TaxID=299642 RepID=A0A8X6MYQ3_NEPPI|nr:uncharacterized protein NPIL_508241 [Nephila pilipes]